MSWEFLDQKFTSLSDSTFTDTGGAAIIAASRSLADGGSAGQLAAALSPKQDAMADGHGEPTDAARGVR